MSAGVRTAFGSGSVFTCKAEHYDATAPGADTGSILVVLTDATQTITSILAETSGDPGGWTLRGSHSAQGRTMWVYDKITGSAEPVRYDVNFTPAIPAGVLVVTWLTDWAVDGIAIRDLEFVDAASGGTTLTFPSMTVVDPGTLWTLVWSRYTEEGGHLRPQPPLSLFNQVLSSGAALYIEEAGSSASTPTGTRSYAPNEPGTHHDGALGVMVIIGGSVEVPTGGGWGVGMVRMGAN